MLPDDRHLIVVGAGGHAKVVIEIAQLIGFQIVGCVSSDGGSGTVLGAPILGDDTALPRLLANGFRQVALAIGANGGRLRLLSELRKSGFTFPVLCHPRASVSPSALIGAATVVMAGAVINASVTIGEATIINTGATVDHDCVIGNGTHIAPGSTLAGGVKVGDRAFLGAGTTVIPRMEIGADAILGAGSVVVGSIPAATKAYGVPASVKAASI